MIDYAETCNISHLNVLLGMQYRMWPGVAMLWDSGSPTKHNLTAFKLVDNAATGMLPGKVSSKMQYNTCLDFQKYPLFNEWERLQQLLSFSKNGENHVKVFTVCPTFVYEPIIAKYSPYTLPLDVQLSDSWEKEGDHVCFEYGSRDIHLTQSRPRNLSRLKFIASSNLITASSVKPSTNLLIQLFVVRIIDKSIRTSSIILGIASPTPQSCHSVARHLLLLCWKRVSQSTAREYLQSWPFIFSQARIHPKERVKSFRISMLV